MLVGTLVYCWEEALKERRREVERGREREGGREREREGSREEGVKEGGIEGELLTLKHLWEEGGTALPYNHLR